MKTIRIIIHPWLLISLFFVILISGESIGGVYLLYLLLALPHGLIHSILGFTGMIVVLTGYYRVNGHSILRKCILIVGVTCMFLSLYYFFHNDSQHYNYGSFKTAAFWITFLLFAISSLTFIIIDRPVKNSYT